MMFGDFITFIYISPDLKKGKECKENMRICVMLKTCDMQQIIVKRKKQIWKYFKICFKLKSGKK